jgi:CrcB protein
MTALLVAVGAGAGAPLRFLAGHYLDGRYPLGTFVVNVLGSFLLGLFSGIGLDGQHAALLGTGFCGAFTTYSALAVKSVDLAGQVSRLAGASYAVGTVLAALVAATAGYALA